MAPLQDVPVEVPADQSDDVTVEPEVPVEPTEASANQLLISGKRHLFCDNFSQAVDDLADACGQYDKVFGELAPECGPAYYWYGNALLELSRTETDLFGEAVKKATGLEDEEDDGRADDGAEDAGEGESEANGGYEVGKRAERAASSANGTSDDKNAHADNEEEDTEDKEDDEEDESSLALSWQMLEIARQVFQHSKDHKMLAQTHLKLAEVLTESGHFQDADTEVESCLNLLYTEDEKDARFIAEASFMGGINILNLDQFAKAKSYFSRAIDLLNERLESLKEEQKQLKASADSDANTKKLASVEQEISDLDSLLPNIEDKLLEASSQMNGETEAPQASLDDSMTNQNAEINSLPVKDIGHLVKRKQPIKSAETNQPIKSAEKQPVSCPPAEHVADDGATKRKAETEESAEETAPSKKQKLEQATES